MSIEPHPRRRLFAKIWLSILIAWTLVLIAPGNWFPGNVASSRVGGIGLGKILHVAAFASLAGSAGWLPLTMRTRTTIAFAMIVHGGLTELIQTLVPFREGCWRDVAIDAAGVVLGYITTRWLWPRDFTNQSNA